MAGLVEVGADVITGVLIDSSRHPQIRPGVWQVVEVGLETEPAVVVATVLVTSRQPNHPRS